MTEFAIMLSLSFFYVVFELFLWKITFKVAGLFVSIFTSDIFSVLEDECSRVRWANRIEFKTVEVFVQM